MAIFAADLPRKHKLTVTDYYRLAQAGSFTENDRVELIEGDIIDIAPIGSVHAGTVNWLGQVLGTALGEKAIIATQNPVRLSATSEPQPDISVLKPRADFYRGAHPDATDVLLLVEVADSSLNYEKQTKLPLYARYGVVEVWLIDVDNRSLAIYRRPRGDTYRQLIDPAPLAPTAPAALPRTPIDLDGLF